MVISYKYKLENYQFLIWIWILEVNLIFCITNEISFTIISLSSSDKFFLESRSRSWAVIHFFNSWPKSFDHLSGMGFKKKTKEFREITRGRIQIITKWITKGYEPLGRNCRRTLLTQLTDRFFGWTLRNMESSPFNTNPLICGVSWNLM